MPPSAFVVCSTPRSGSGLLCRALARTGLAGAPAEYLNPSIRVPLGRRLRTGRDVKAYLEALRASSGAVFGIKIHWDQLDDLRRELRRQSAVEVLDELFPDATYVSIERNEVDRQAVSLWTAINTGVWTTTSGAASLCRRVPYSFHGIRWQRDVIVRGREAWRAALAEAGVHPLRVAYEELVAAYEATISRTLEHVAGRSLAHVAVPAPETGKLADARSEELLRRFERDPGTGTSLARADRQGAQRARYPFAPGQETG